MIGESEERGNERKGECSFFRGRYMHKGKGKK